MSRQPNGGFIGKENITDNTNASGVYTLSDVAQKVADNEFPTARYTPSRSLRFRSSASAFLSRTPASAGNRKTWTWSGWIKRGTVSNNSQGIFESPSSGSTFASIYFTSGDIINWYEASGGATVYILQTSQVFRDPSAWYHLVCVYDSTQATSSNRQKMYVNGVQITAFSTAIYVAQNSNGRINSAVTHKIGTFDATNDYLDGYLTEINFVDGQALTPASFGEYEERTGEWKAKRYAGTYGTNGFYLSFANNSSTSALGLDDGTGLAGSGSGSNDWTTNNFSLTAGATYDSMVDVPGVGSSVINDTGGVTRGNYCTMNLLDNNSSGFSLTNGNLTFVNSSAVAVVRGSMGFTSGKIYFEITQASSVGPSTPFNYGIASVNGPAVHDNLVQGALMYTDGNSKQFWRTTTAGIVQTVTPSSFSVSVNDIMQFAYDCDTGKVWFGKNNIWYDGSGGTSGNPSTGANPVFTLPDSSQPMTPVFEHAGAVYTAHLNCGQRPFVYAPPTGFKTLCTTNLPEPDIKRPVDHFDVKLWTGNGSDQTIGNTARERDNYEISRSLRFNANDSNHLSFTPAVAGNRKTWTWSSWVKRGNLGISGCAIFSAAVNNQNAARGVIDFNSTDTLRFGFNDGTTWYIAETTARFRDVSAWYHIVVKCDLSNATQSSRAAIYVNGVQQSTNSVSWINADQVFNNSVVHTIGRTYSNGALFDGYMAEINFIDGQALDPESFGVFDVDGSWQAKRYTGTYGTNGFYLDFSDNSNTTVTTLGKDRAGANNWTPNNFSVAAGVDNDSMVDVPTNFGGDEVDSGGEVRGNYATLNPLNKDSQPTITNGNLNVSMGVAGGGWRTVPNTIAMPTGKWYAEVVFSVLSSSASGAVGIAAITTNFAGLVYPGLTATSYGYHSNGNKVNNDVTTAYGATWTTGDVLGIAFDATAGTLTFYKNNVSQGTAYTSISDAFEYYFIVGGANVTNTCNINFGQRAFAYDPPAGFKSLNTKNMNEQSPFVSGPDLVWIKVRNAVNSHYLFDTVRGADRALFTDSTSAETDYTATGRMTRFNSNGFDVRFSASTGTNAAGSTYVAWCWNAGSRTIGNQDGTITSTVRANPEAGFSIVSYTGTGSNATVGHGLGVKPAMVIAKGRQVTNNWLVWHQNLSAENSYLHLETTGAQVQNSAFFSAFSSTTFSLGNSAHINSSGLTNVAYCFAEVEGYSKFGTYTGNGSVDGPFIYTGFRPAFVLAKCSSSNQGGNAWWVLYDNKRIGSNPDNRHFGVQVVDVEYSTNSLDILSNGFKWRDTNSARNASGSTYIYAAFAEQPFKHAVAR